MLTRAMPQKNPAVSQEQFDVLKADLLNFKQTNEDLQLRVSSLEGRNIRLENRVEELTGQLDEVTARTMQKNLLFHGIAEKKGEKLEDTLTLFFTKELKIDKKVMTSKVEIDVAYRLGKFAPAKPRPILASFTTKSAVDLLRSKSLALKDGPYRLSEQLPRETRVRRITQIPLMLDLRTKFPDSKILLKQDKLFQDGKLVRPEFSANRLRVLPNPTVVTDVTNILQTDSMIEKGSRFRGYGRHIDSLQEAQACIAALYQADEVAEATHTIYAYRLKDSTSGLMIEGHHDDGEWGASASIASILAERQMEGIFLAVTRKYGGTDLGKRRFTIIQELATKALDATVSMGNLG